MINKLDDYFVTLQKDKIWFLIIFVVVIFLVDILGTRMNQKRRQEIPNPEVQQPANPGLDSSPDSGRREIHIRYLEELID